MAISDRLEQLELQIGQLKEAAKAERKKQRQKELAELRRREGQLGSKVLARASKDAGFRNELSALLAGVIPAGERADWPEIFDPIPAPSEVVVSAADDTPASAEERETCDIESDVDFAGRRGDVAATH